MSHLVTPPKAIETTCDGYRFRSRLEARWAVAFNALGEPWLYEQQGYHLASSTAAAFRYLPDFYLPRRQLWVEVKGTEEAFGKAWRAVFMAAHPEMGLPADPDGSPVSLTGEVPRIIALGPIPRASRDLVTRAGFLLLELLDGHVVLRRGDLLGAKTPVLANLSARVDVCVPTGSFGLEPLDIDVVLADEDLCDEESRRIDYAFTCARSARFEHGEGPDVVPWRAGEPRPW